MFYDLEDTAIGCFSLVVGIGLTVLVTWGILGTVDALHYERKAFTQMASCDARRMESRRKFLSDSVICVPAYRATKSDTLRLEGVK